MRLALAAAAVLVAACTHAPPIDDPKDQAPVAAKVPLSCIAPVSGPQGPGFHEGRRVAGSRYVPLSDATLVRLRNRHYHRVSVRVETCVDATGAVSCLDFGSRPNPHEIVQTLVDALQEWKYEPATLDGKPVPVCFAVNFNYMIQ
jgi:hypothetical protein